jgi:UTP--glucose-1-phosphate uridylyltransferase
MTIKKAVILAAGYATRVLPATKAMPKEMTPIADKPAIQYIAEELAASGVTDIILVLSRGKDVIMRHFDRSPEIEAILQKRNNPYYETVKAISEIANFACVYQKEMTGTATSLMCAKPFIGKGEPFITIYPDDIILGKTPAAKQVIEEFDRRGVGITAMREFPGEQIVKYGTLGLGERENTVYGGFTAKLTGMREKPPTEAEALSHYAIIGRMALPYKIFDLLDDVKPGAGGERYITDAMLTLVQSEGMYGVAYEGTHYDMGSKLGILKANAAVGLTHPETGAEYRRYLEELIKQ